AFVFESYPYRISPAASKDVVRSLAVGLPEALLPPSAETKSLKWWGLLLQGLLPCLARIDAERLRTWVPIGREQAVRAAHLPDVDGPSARAGRPGALLDELERDSQLRGLARLARHLRAVVTLPRPIADRHDLPLGGVSDIANRGRLDRLLLS